MKGTFVRTAVVLAVLGGLGGYAWFVERGKPVKPLDGEEAGPKEKVFDGLVRQRVEELRIEPRGGEAVRLGKRENAWRLLAPLDAAADAAQVETLLGGLENMEAQQVAAESPTDLAEFGLEPAAARVEVHVAGERAPRVLLIGDKVPASGEVFAQLSARRRVFTIPGYVAQSFEKKAFDLRDRNLLKIQRDAVRGLEVSGPEGRYALSREADEWTITAPVRTRAGRYSVDGFVGLLESLRFDEVAAEDARDLKPWGLHKPTRTVALKLADGSTKTLEIGSSPADKKFHARVGGASLVTVIPGAVVEDLEKGLDNWRAKRLLEIATYQVTGIEIREGDKVRKLARSTVKGADGFDEQKWKRTAPDAKDVETKLVDDALFKLGGTEVNSFVDAPKALSSYGLDKPAFRLQLALEKGEPAWLELGQQGGAWHARRPGDDALLALDAAKADELIKAFAGL